jgi:iron complex transport system permease protein
MATRFHFGALVVLLVVVFLVALLVGSQMLSPSAWWQSLWQSHGFTQARSPVDLILGWRLARALAAVAVGMLLGLSGALLQALLRNPLADPYVLGISGGASCAAVLAMLLGADMAWMAGAAAAGGLLSLAALFLLARNSLFGRDALADSGNNDRLILSGVMIGAVFSAVLSILLTLSSDHGLRGVVYWLLGDFGAVTSTPMAVGVLVLALLALIRGARDAGSLTLMLAGDLQAFTQGIDAGSVRRRLVLLTGLASGLAVAVAGAVGFVGFIAPHLARRLVGSDQTKVLPFSALIGAILVLSVDTLARTLFAPVQLPVGALMALLGAPLFFWRLHKTA